MQNQLIVQFKVSPEIMRTRNIDGVKAIATGSDTVLEFLDAEEPQSNEWDQAHALFDKDDNIAFAEPDVNVSLQIPPESLANENEIDGIKYDEFIAEWPFPKESKNVWHLAENYSQLKAARDAVYSLPKKAKIRIVHLDTGYDEDHDSFPKELVNISLSRNFVDGEDLFDARDRFTEGMLKNPGHGTGTLSILAGRKMPIAGIGTFDDYIGLSEAIEIVPIRIAESVVLFKSSSFVKALDYIVNELNSKEETRVHVVTMSMGGLASKAWADLVNEAYDQGVFIVTAAGNNYNKLPTRRLVFPARFNRVVAACGATYDYSPYAKPDGEGNFSLMEGNHGPKSLMRTAIAAFTPNVPWAIWKKKDLFGIRGNGTSSATPQIASAAALYYCKHYEALESLPDRYMIVEAIRNALFSTALKKMDKFEGSYEYYFGNGILQAAEALKVPVPDVGFLRNKKEKKDTVFLPFIRLILGLRSGVSTNAEMLEAELMQLALSDPEIQRLIDNPDTDDISELSNEQRVEFAALIRENPRSSQALKSAADRIINKLE
jgi:subtilisin family serine protease